MSNARHFMAVMLALPVLAASAWAQSVDVSLALEPKEQAPGGDVTALVQFSCPSGLHVQADGLTIKLDDEKATAPVSALGPPRFPEPKQEYDKLLEMDLRYFEGRFRAEVPLRVSPEAGPGQYEVAFSVDYVACEADRCLMETARASGALTVVETAQAPARKPPSSPAQVGGTVEETARKFSGLGALGAVLMAFLAGLGLTLTPCVYPLIPITIGIVGATAGRSRLDSFLRSVIYVLGIATIYSVAGAAAAATGSMFGDFLQHPAVYLVLAGVFVVLAGGMFGWYSIQFTSARLQRFQAGLSGRAGLLGIWVVGLLSGAAVTACTAPVIAGFLLYVGRQGSPLLGFLVFFALAWGFGTPLVVIGTFTGLLKSIPRSGEWMVRVSKFFGLALLGLAIYFVGRSALLPAAWYRAFVGLCLLAVSVFVGAFDRLPADAGGWPRLRKALGLLLVVVGLAVLLMVAGVFEPGVLSRDKGPRVEWLSSEAEAIQRAQEDEKPVLLDFWTKRCPACVKLLKVTFRDAQVVSESRRFVCARVDLSDRNDPEVRRLIGEYQIRGVPQLALIGTDGRRQTRAGYIPPARMLEIMKTVR
ncbi:MAG: thioredoxin family protein [Planctomycetes bacterium]|nr:thioredoxin family protein [Planctomycetota bacterium]